MFLCFAVAAARGRCRGIMEVSQRDRLSELVEQLTTSGQPQLNESKMKEIKKICKCVKIQHKLYISMTTDISVDY